MIKTLELDTDIIIYAFRYCLGRETYSVLTMTEFLTKNWHELTPHQQSLIKREIKEADSNPGYGGYGLGNPNIDRPKWLKILELKDLHKASPDFKNISS
jgi:hypothetical protein